MTTVVQCCKNTIVSLLNFLTGTKEFSSIQKRLIAIMSLLVAISLSYFEYSYVEGATWWNPWKKDTTINVSINPSLVSTSIAILLILPHYIRSRAKISFYCLMMFSMNIIFFASVISVFVSGAPWKIPFISVSSQTLLFGIVLLSWIGMRSLSGLLWLVLFSLFVFRITEINVAMGQAGVAYVITATLSIICQIFDTETSYIKCISNDFFIAKEIIREDIEETKKSAQSLASKI